MAYPRSHAGVGQAQRASTYHRDPRYGPQHCSLHLTTPPSPTRRVPDSVQDSRKQLMLSLRI
jgi:hypothetical protein